jgi:hypothetical protein
MREQKLTALIKKLTAISWHYKCNFRNRSARCGNMLFLPTYIKQN